MKNSKIINTVFGRVVTSFMLVVLVSSPLSVFAEDNSKLTDDGSNTDIASVSIPALVCDPNIELAKNGGFEDVVVTESKKWTIFDWSTPNLGWTSNINAYGLEIQAGYTEDALPWAPFAGSQYAEIDGGSTLTVSNSITTVPGVTYKLSLANSPRPHVNAENNIVDVSANGTLLATLQADGSALTNTSWTEHGYTFVATTTTTLIGFTDKGTENDGGYGMFLDAVSVRCVIQGVLPPVPPANTAPTITLLGDNPMTVVVGTMFTDPGATANDAEDGNLTSAIVKSGSVNASTTGTYTLTYSVTDSKGAATSVNRTVQVIPYVITHSCVTANSLGDSTVEPIVHGSDSVSLQDVFNAKGIAKNVISDQKQYQTLSFNNVSTTLTFEFVSRTASYSSTLGYYNAGNIGSFTPVFNSGTNIEGYSTTTTITGAGNLGLAIKVDQTSDTWASENSLNSGTTDQAAFYELAENTFIVAFEDLPFASSDKDYNDLLVKVTVTCDKTVTPPVIIHSCMLPATLGDATTETVIHGLDTYSLQDIFNQNSINKDVTADQKQYQEWGAPTTTTSVKFDFISRNAALDSVFGYYTSASSTTFTPVFRSGSVTGFASTTVLNAGQSVTVNIPAGSPVGLSIKTSAGTSFYTHNSLNEGASDHAVVYETASSTYILGFEDWELAPSDKDYNDIVVRMTITCGTATTTPPIPPTPPTPTVTLTANPTSLTTTGTSTLSWISTNTTSCSAPWTSATSTSGSQIVTLATTTDYAMTCTGSYGSVSATTTITVSSTTPPVTPPGGGGGGDNGGGGNGGGGSSSGGGSSGGGRRHDVTNLLGTGEVLGVSSTCSYLRDFLRRDWDNNKIEMLKLQSFLNAFEKENLTLNATFDQATFDAVSRFQNKYFSDILEPWGHTAPTGFVYILTKKKINEIYCNTLLSLNQSEKNEIAAFRAFIQSHPDLFVGGGVGSNVSGTGSIGAGTAGENSVPTPGSIAKSVARNLAVSAFSIPQNASGWIMWLIIILILAAIISAVTRFLRREKPAIDHNEEASLYSDPIESDEPIAMPGKTETSFNTSLPDDEIVIDNGEEEEIV